MPKAKAWSGLIRQLVGHSPPRADDITTFQVSPLEGVTGGDQGQGQGRPAHPPWSWFPDIGLFPSCYLHLQEAEQPWAELGGQTLNPALRALKSPGGCVSCPLSWARKTRVPRGLAFGNP